MKLIHFGLSGTLLDDGIDFAEWIIESPESFSGYVLELSTQIDGNEGQFVLSDKNKELDLAKKAELIFNPFTVEFTLYECHKKKFDDAIELADPPV